MFERARTIADAVLYEADHPGISRTVARAVDEALDLLREVIGAERKPAAARAAAEDGR